VLSHRITFAQIVWLSIFQGVINAFDMPARQAFLTEMVDNRDDLPNAIALNSSMVNGSRMIGPSLAGLVVAGFGEGWCFFLDGASYIAVIGSLLAMRFTARRIHQRTTSVIADIVEGWKYVSEFTPVRNLLLLLALVSFVGMPYTVLMPIMAGNVLHGGPNTMGLLMGASGVGALASALMLAGRKSVVGLGRVVPLSTGIFGVGLVAFGVSRWLPLSMMLMVITGYGMMQEMAASNTILQTIVPEDKRGRAMSFYAMAFAGTAPFGSLGAGYVAQRIGAPTTLVIGGIACVLGAVWFMTQLGRVREMIRPIYIRLGILPELATGIQTATAIQETER
jgi:MFS family permease